MIFLWLSPDVNKYRKTIKQSEFRLPSKARTPQFPLSRLSFSPTASGMKPNPRAAVSWCLASGGPPKKKSSNSINFTFRGEKHKYWEVKRPSQRSHKGHRETHDRDFPKVSQRMLGVRLRTESLLRTSPLWKLGPAVSLPLNVCQLYEEIQSLGGDMDRI